MLYFFGKLDSYLYTILFPIVDQVFLTLEQQVLIQVADRNLLLFLQQFNRIFPNRMDKGYQHTRQHIMRTLEQRVKFFEVVLFHRVQYLLSLGHFLGVQVVLL